MTTNWRKVVSALLFIHLICHSTEEWDISLPPESLIVYENTIARFTCKGDGLVVTWSVNSVLLANPQPQGDWVQITERDSNGLMNVLEVIARRQLNNTVITCVTGDQSSYIESDPATLQIQGKIGPVTNLKISVSKSKINLSWDPPFSLDVTGVNPNVWYNIIITYETDKNEHYEVDCYDCNSLTESHYVFTPSDICVIYNFTIVSQNGIGKSDLEHKAPLPLQCSVTEQQSQDHRRNVISRLYFGLPPGVILLAAIVMLPLCYKYRKKVGPWIEKVWSWINKKIKCCKNAGTSV